MRAAVVTIPVGALSATSATSCSFDVYAPNSPFSTINFEDNMENGTTNWTVTTGAGTVPWVLDGSNPNSGTQAWFIPNSDTISDHSLMFASPITLTGGNPAISFWHAWDTDNSKDGGVVEMTIDNGLSWIDLGPMMRKNAYNGNIQADTNNVVGGRKGFTGQSNGYVNTLIDLTGWTGAPIQLRFLFGSNDDTGGLGWYIDDVRILNLETVVNSACVTSDQGDQDCDDATTIILQPLTNTEDIPELSGIQIYPNPTDSDLTIDVTSEISNARFRMVQIDGKVLFSDHLTIGINQIDVSRFGAGIYIAEVIADEGVFVQKVIVQ